MVSKSGFASAAGLTVSPLISTGASSGMNTTVAIVTMGMKAPANPTSPRAFPTTC
jgi:hypothetical protein